ncbi:rRNA processing protein [Microbotryomycetes sp. JL201]|nr:rRNA processing protein [Microbotryomycetes sp. JL201]
MPKSTKHKKARAADFTKAKLKLGKGKQLAANATNTSFASKSIALPNQTLSEQPKQGPTSRRNHTLPELLVQTRHYSSNVKKEALVDILQLVQQYPFLVKQHLVALLASLSHVLQDLTPTVRSTCFAILNFVTETVPSRNLASVSQTLLFFTVSALSALDEGVRLDALKVVDLLLDAIPERVTQGWTLASHVDLPDNGIAMSQSVTAVDQDGGVGSNVIKALLGMLRIRSAALKQAQGSYTSASSSDLSPRARKAVLSTLANFLEIASAPRASTSSAFDVPWYLASSFSSDRAFQNFLSSSALSSHDDDGGLPLSSLGLPDRFNRSAIQTTSERPPSLLTMLHPTLLSSFLDAAPTAFSPADTFVSTSAGVGDDLQLVLAVVNVSKHLYWSELGSADVVAIDGEHENGRKKDKERQAARKSLVGLLSHAAAYFPFGGDELRERSAEEEGILTQLNMTFASLVSLLAFTADGSATKSRHSKPLSKAKAQKQDDVSARIEIMVDNVKQWVLQALKGELTSKSHPMGLSLSSQSYTALEPTLWSLLNASPSRLQQQQSRPPSQSASEIWSTVVKHCLDSSATSETKRVAFSFISNILVTSIDVDYVNAFDAFDELNSNVTRSFLSSLTKLVWEAGTRSQDVTGRAFELLATLFKKDVLMRDGDDKSSRKVVEHLVKTAGPFFSFTRPTGKKGEKSFGPFASVRRDVQVKSLAFVYWVSVSGKERGVTGLPELVQSVDAVMNEVDENKVAEDVRRYWTTVRGMLAV